MTSKPTANAVDQSIDEYLSENWNAIARRSASSTTRRVLTAQTWERRLAYVNRVTRAVGVLLVVQFPVACYALEKIEESALEFCAAL